MIARSVDEPLCAYSPDALLRDTDGALALGGADAPRDDIRASGWELTSPLKTTKDLSSYRSFISSSWADLGIAKGAYVLSRSGWFSDRSTCYLASGRPVLHQDTGFGDWLPEGEGVLAFSEMSGLVECIDRLENDYERHALGARRVAEEYFEASKVIEGLLEAAGYR